MTPEEQAAKSSVEQAQFGALVEPDNEDLAAFAAEAQKQAEMSAPDAGDFLTEGRLILDAESDDQVGKPTLSGA